MSDNSAPRQNYYPRQQLSIHSHSGTPHMTAKHSKTFLSISGNHSCEPNAEVTFPYNNSTLALKALCSIQPGEVYGYLCLFELPCCFKFEISLLLESTTPRKFLFPFEHCLTFLKILVKVDVAATLFFFVFVLLWFFLIGNSYLLSWRMRQRKKSSL